MCSKLTVQGLSLGPSWSSRAQGWLWPSRWCGPVNSCHPSVAWSGAHARLQVHPPSAPCLVQLIVLSKQDFLEGGGRSALWHEPHLTGPGLRARHREACSLQRGSAGLTLLSSERLACKAGPQQCLEPDSGGSLSLNGLCKHVVQAEHLLSWSLGFHMCQAEGPT